MKTTTQIKRMLKRTLTGNPMQGSNESQLPLNNKEHEEIEGVFRERIKL